MTIIDQSWTPDVTLTGAVRELFDSAIAAYRANHNLVSEHANHEESIRVGGYANRTLLELVQNAADAMAGAAEGNGGNAGRVEIVLDRDRRTLYCANSGRPFSKSGLISIAHAHLSGKRGDEIGRFGLGFKSVLAVSDSPQIFSRSISFEFNSTESMAALADIPCTARRYPTLRTATVVDPHAAFENDPILAELAEWASTIVRLPGASNLDRLRAEIKDFPSEFLLFVGAVRQVRLRVLGEDGFNASHVSHDFGDGHFKIERSDGAGDEWFVQDRMHRPTTEARRQVGEAVSRAEVKVTVAMPLRHAKHRTGRLWSYFPLQDETSASALFNAPWSVNDDRTTLLRNKYNHEILETLSNMFVHMLPKVSSKADPAAHLDYMPARGREALSFGDELLCAYVPKASADVELVPDANGTMRFAADLRPLDFFSTVDDSTIHEAWIKSPNTGDDVPHWRCYGTQQRFARLRQLFAAEVVHDLTSEDGGLKKADRDLKKTLDGIPKRGLRSWLQEWAGGPDLASAAAAVRFAIEHQHKLPDAAQAKVVPTTGGLRALRDRHFIFLHQEEDVDIEEAVFVLPKFLAQPGIEDLLRRNNFRDLDPEAVLNARVARLSTSSGDTEFGKLWDAVMGVPIAKAVKALAGNQQHVKVPTRDGGWAFPYQVFDLDAPLADQFAPLTLDPNRCLSPVAHRIGVIQEPVKDFLVEDEVWFQQYRTSVLHAVNDARGPGERPVENVDIYPGKGPGPFSMLFMLRDVAATPDLRARWTVKLLETDDADWTCDDTDTGKTHAIQSPVKWAVELVGLLPSTRGIRAPHEVVAPSLLQYEDFLPLFRGSGRIAEALGLADLLEDVPIALIEEALAAELFPPRIEDTVLVDFVLAASRIVSPVRKPARIPARVGRMVESCAPNSVYIATTDEQAGYLASRQRPCLRATDEQVGDLVEVVGCRRFEESFTFSMFIEGQQESERVLDIFTGLRNTLNADKVHNATLAKAIHVAKRTTTEDGVEDQSLEWHLADERDLVVRSDVDGRRLLEVVNNAFGLGLTNAQLEEVRRAGLDHRLESLRQQAAAAATDAARLELYLGSDDMRDALPKGLWQALESQGHVDDETSVAELLLTVYGKGSIRHLKDLFLQEGFSDVPTNWAGGASTITWLRKMAFGAEYAGRPTRPQEHEFVVPGAVKLTELHQFQKKISRQMKDVLTLRDANGRRLKAMVELPTGAGKTRVATQTVLQLFVDGQLQGPVLWIAQSQELCEQAVQTWSTVWRGMGDERPLTIGRLWENHTVTKPDTAFSIIVATDAKLDSVLGDAEYKWLRTPSAVIVDEGHRAGGSERYTRILSLLGIAGRGWERPLVGLSATPFKGKSHSATAALASRFGNRKLEAFEADTAYTQLAGLGVLAQVEHKVLEGVDIALSPQEMAEVKSQRKISPGVLDRVGQNQRRMAILIDHIRNLDPTWPVLVFTPSVLSAQVLAATLRFHDIEAHAVSGQTGRQERRDIIDQFKDGKIRVLANCDLLIQGFDAPGVRALYIARPTFSPNAYIQMAGRGLRGPANGGKEKCLIVDMADNFGDVSDLLGYREYEDLWQEQRA
ncbi:DEAD/DEAH box helicase [Lentzea sp. NPDC102401]|uniref:DEAD/DEAH box helicase n=1 Tax=Lentzea sp. NPDC102401 TaxID=3364128 RepID=UPI0038239A36